MTTTEDLAQRLADAHKAGRHDVDPTPYSRSIATRSLTSSGA